MSSIEPSTLGFCVSRDNRVCPEEWRVIDPAALSSESSGFWMLGLWLASDCVPREYHHHRTANLF